LSRAEPSDHRLTLFVGHDSQLDMDVLDAFDGGDGLRHLSADLVLHGASGDGQ
jgi:hypothetical protein